MTFMWTQKGKSNSLNSITVLINGVTNLNIEQTKSLLETIPSTFFNNNRIQVLFAVSSELRNYTRFYGNFSNNIHFYEMNEKKNGAITWKVLAKKARTNYIFVGRHLQTFKNMLENAEKMLYLLKY